MREQWKIVLFLIVFYFKFGWLLFCVCINSSGDC